MPLASCEMDHWWLYWWLQAFTSQLWPLSESHVLQSEPNEEMTFENHPFHLWMHIADDATWIEHKLGNMLKNPVKIGPSIRLNSWRVLQLWPTWFAMLAAGLGAPAKPPYSSILQLKCLNFLIIWCFSIFVPIVARKSPQVSLFFVQTYLVGGFNPSEKY